MTERVNKNVVVGDKVRTMARQALDEENYDIDNGEVTKDEIAAAVANLAMALVGRGVNKDLVVKQVPVSLFALGYSWKAQSGHPNSWVSCSDDNRTGVGRQVCPFFADPFQIDIDEVTMLLECMSEAWYLMKNKME